jgi:cytochrome c biogenesis protein CcmG/thiol:disulfide interchange protein DsbE
VPCRVEHATLIEIALANQVPLYGIAYKDKVEDARHFLGELGNPYRRIGVDAAGRTAIDFGVYGVPETYLVDATGRIRFRWAGPISEEVLRRELLPRLAALEGR